MSTISKNKSIVGRQAHLPLQKAMAISMNSLKIRFWRSMVTASGIFLGIAFLATVLTQLYMQWPVASKVDAGYVKLDGQVNGPGNFEVYKPVPIEEGKAAGIPDNVIESTRSGENTFNLTGVIQGKLQEARAKKNLVRVNKEWVQLSKFKDDMAFYVAVLGGADIKLEDAVKAGVPEDVVKKLAGTSSTFKGADLVEVLREQPKWINPIYFATAMDQDISAADADRAGIPHAIAQHLIGSGQAFKGTALNDAITAHPTWIAIWKARVKRYEKFNNASDDAINKLAKNYAISLNDALAAGKNPDMKTADMGHVMIVNPNGRKVSVNFVQGKTAAGNIALADGDCILVPDKNTRYRMLWLVGMSLLVCTVGIANSMLMAVTERFKEIGTMKCLGALDSFVVTLFLLESGMMGVCASVLGWTVGFIAMILIAAATKGWAIIATIGLWDVVGSFVLCVFVGMFLTLCATIAPAIRAANMPAAMALRSEI